MSLERQNGSQGWCCSVSILLSALLFGCLTFSAAHNAELQAQFQQTAVGDHHHIMQESKISLSEW